MNEPIEEEIYTEALFFIRQTKKKLLDLKRYSPPLPWITLFQLMPALRFIEGVLEKKILAGEQSAEANRAK